VLLRAAVVLIARVVAGVWPLQALLLVSATAWMLWVSLRWVSSMGSCAR
jgi:hypothetical protein